MTVPMMAVPAAPMADSALAQRMARCLDHRGPDGSGVYANGPLAFGAGRLAIIDLAAQAGPLFNEDRRVSVVFNGEIYNYKPLRAELERSGHCFATQTDTEVIVHGYEAWGLGVLDRLRGMFALGIWDEREEGARRLLLARDRLGEKPLYYTQSGDQFLFASEIKALFECPSVPRRVNLDALPFYLALGYSPPPLTLFEGIYKLAPGEFLLIEPGGMRVERYWRPTMDTTDTAQTMGYAETVRRVRQAVTEAVEMRLMSDVPLGAFLSGGLDSTAVVALMGRALGRPVQTFTVGFDVPPGSKEDTKFNVDARYAALASRRLGTEHRAISIRPDERLAWLLPRLIYALDEPLAQPAIIQTAYVAALARQSGVPVLLSGDAGDELFAGYPAYRADRILERYLGIPGLLRAAILSPLLERLPARFDGLRKLAQKSRDTDPTRRYLTWMKLLELEHLPGLLRDSALAASGYVRIAAVLRPLLDAPRTRHFADRIAFASLSLWLAEDSNMRVDKMSMAVSIEARAPLEDHKLVELAFSIPLAYKLRGGGFKMVFKDAVADLVPSEILARPKWGFFPPISEWLRAPNILRPLVDTYLAPERVAAAGIFDPAAVAGIARRHIVERQYALWPLWALLVFHLWHALYITGDLTLPDKLRPADLMP